MRTGLGYAFEAAQAVVRFAFDDARLVRLRAGHAYDNTESGRVVIKLGFKSLDPVQRNSQSRGETIIQHRYVLEAHVSN